MKYFEVANLETNERIGIVLAEDIKIAAIAMTYLGEEKLSMAEYGNLRTSLGKYYICSKERVLGFFQSKEEATAYIGLYETEIARCLLSFNNVDVMNQGQYQHDLNHMKARGGEQLQKWKNEMLGEPHTNSYKIIQKSWQLAKEAFSDIKTNRS